MDDGGKRSGREKGKRSREGEGDKITDGEGSTAEDSKRRKRERGMKSSVRVII